MIVQMPDGTNVSFPDDMPKEQIRALIEKKFPQAKPPDTLSDVGQSIGSGLVTGTMGAVGLPGDISSGIGAAGGWIGGLFGKSPQEQKDIANTVRRAVPVFGAMPTSGEISNASGYSPYIPQTEAGRFANKAASFVPGAAAIGLSGGLAAVPMAAAGGAVSGLTSQVGGNVAATVGGEKARPYGEIAGGLVGGFAPNAARRAVTPFPATPERTAAVNTLRGEGVNSLTAGQQTGNTALRYFESEVGGPRVTDALRTQGEQYTAAALNRAGENANRATPDVVNGMFARIGNDFNQLGQRNTLLNDAQLTNDVRGATGNYNIRVNAPMRAPIVAHYQTEIDNAIAANGGRIPGDVYQSLRSRIAADARSSGGDQYVQQALNGMREALDNAMERSISLTNPGDLGAWRQAREQYRAALVIEKAAATKSENPGIVTPSQLHGATIAVYGQRAFVRGGTPFDELARAGETTMKPLPQSGTAPRARAIATMGAPAAVGAVLAGKYGGGDIATTLAGMIAGGASASALRALLMSPAGRAYLANQRVTGQGLPWEAQAAISGTNVTQPYRLPLPRGPSVPAIAGR